MFLALLMSLITAGAPLEVSLWTDREGAPYSPGDLLTIYFSANQSCYVAVYNIEQGGGVTLLFPPESDNGWVRGGQVYQLPPDYADYDYRVTGPAGVETIILVASVNRLPTLNDEAPDIISEVMDIEIKEPEPAELIIVTVPRRCRIYVSETESGDREYAGESPRAIVLKPGEYTVEIKKAGYRTLRRTVSLNPGEKRKVHVQL
jgi:hypothetical protein